MRCQQHSMQASRALTVAALFAAAVPISAESSAPAGSYQEWVALFQAWRAFERPPTTGDARRQRNRSAGVFTSCAAVCPGFRRW